MKIVSNNLLNTTKHYAKKIILPTAFATSLIGCIDNYKWHQVEADTFETVQPREFSSSEKRFQEAIFQALPYIKDGKFKKVEAMNNGIILDDKYKLYKKDKNYYEGRYSLFDNHSFKINKLKNGNFNFIYKNDDDIEALAFSKDGKLLSKFEAFKQNSEDGPYKAPFGRIGDCKTVENTDDKIVKFNNPLSDKEFNIIKNLILSPLSGIKLVKAKQEGDMLIFNYNKYYDYPEGEYTIKAKNAGGLNYNSTFDSDSRFQKLIINTLDNGGYAIETSYMSAWGEDKYITYFDKDLNLKDFDWYVREKTLRAEIEKALSAKQKEAALENIRNGQPVQYKLGDNYLILLPKPNENVVGNTSLQTRAVTSCEEIRKAIDNLDPKLKGLIVVGTISIGGIMVEAVMLPTAPMIALGAELATFKLVEE